MPLTCNIDKRGRIARLIWGVTLLILAAVILALLLMTDHLVSRWWFVCIAGLSLFGLFAIFEAKRGWCIMRAMGFKTRM